MTVQKTPHVPMRRGLRIALVASLALNLAVAGLAIGAAFNWQRGGPPRSLDFAAGPLAQALPEEDRREIGRRIRQDPSLRLPSRRDLDRGMLGLVEIIRTEPFDQAALEAALADMQDRVTQVRSVAAGEIVERIATMSAAQRATYASELVRLSGGERHRRSNN